LHIDVDAANAMIGAYFPGMVAIEFIHIEPGHSICRCVVNERLHNPGGILHGGVPFSMADTGMAIALMALIDDGRRFSTIETKMSYYRAVVSGELICSTRVVKLGRRIAFLESEIRNNTEIVAQATGSYYVADPA
jgi:acyl-CoA thioesterase